MTTRDGGGPRVLLIGMMGAGKSAVGRAVAARTGWRYVDNDDLVRQATGRTAAQVAATEGEAALRAVEAAALAAVLALPPPAIASVAGGVVLDEAGRELLKQADRVIWLRASPATLAVRIGDGDGEGRPWLARDPALAIAALAAEREPYYTEVADAIIDVDGLTTDQAADAVLDVT